ncbi:hypothetical protein [Streptacidiphilus sp. PAMC 29251]
MVMQGGTSSLRLRVLVTALFLASTASCASVLSGDNSGYRITNDLRQDVWLVSCSQNRPDFPGATKIAAKDSLQLEGDWLPADDPGAACFLSSSPSSSRASFQGCLKMPTADNGRTEYEVSEAEGGITKSACMALSRPGPP